MKAMRTILIATILALAVVFVSACDEAPGCTQCGFEPGEHIVTSYTDSDGASISVSGYANSSGCFTPDGCR